MRKALIAIMVGGAFVLNSMGALAQNSSGNLESRGEAKFEALQQAREACFEKLHATYEAIEVKGSKSGAAKAALAKALGTIDATVLPVLNALETALENYDDEDGVVRGAAELEAAIAAAKRVIDALPGLCETANATLQAELTDLAKTSITDEEDNDNDVDSDHKVGSHERDKKEPKDRD